MYHARRIAANANAYLPVFELRAWEHSSHAARNPDGTYNLQFIEDFIRNAIKQQVLWAKRMAEAHYEMRPAYN